MTSSSPARKAWSVFRRELLSIQQAIRHFLPDIYGREITIYTDHKAILGAITAPILQVNDPIAQRQLLEISQYSYDIRYKPGKANVTADQMSRPAGVPIGDAYNSINLDTIAAVKKTMTDITPLTILQHQSKSTEIENIVQGKHSPRITPKWIEFKGQKLLCDTSRSIRPIIPSSLKGEILQNFQKML